MYFYSTKEQIAQEVQKFDQLMDRLRKGYYCEDIGPKLISKEPTIPPLLIRKLQRFDADSFYKPHILIKLDIAIGAFSISFAAPIDNQKALWAVRSSKKVPYLEIPLEEYIDEHESYLKFWIEIYLEKGFDAIKNIFYSSEDATLKIS